MSVSVMDSGRVLITSILGLIRFAKSFSRIKVSLHVGWVYNPLIGWLSCLFPRTRYVIRALRLFVFLVLIRLATE